MDLIGAYHARIGLDTMERLLAEAEHIGLFSMDDTYDAQVTDLPSTMLHLVSGDRDKHILARYHVPPTLKAFAMHADSLLLPAGWKPAGK